MSSPINSLWKKPPLPVYKQTEANDSIHCVQQVSLARLTSTNHTCLYKKLDEFGKGHDKPLHEAVAKQSDYMTSMHKHPLTENKDQPLEKSNKTKCPNTHCGCKMVFDNLVYAQEVHSMTGDHQTAIVIMSLQCRPKTGCPVQGSALKHHSLDCWKWRMEIVCHLLLI